MAVNLLGRLAARAAVPVFVMAGAGGRAKARALRAEPRVRLVSTPRDAAICLVIGPIAPAFRRDAERVHDQVPPPRGVVFWGDVGAGAPLFRPSAVVQSRDDPVDTLVTLFRRLMTGEHSGEQEIGPVKNPTPWKGLGPHGQGGQGMMGGEPYGRAMAMTGDDLRDGLALDRLSVPLGPFVPWMPAGARMQVVLQGDLVVDLDVRTTTLMQPDRPPVFATARHSPVSVARLERARAHHALQWATDMLALHGLHAWATRLAMVATQLRRDGARRVRTIADLLRRSGALTLATRGIGVMHVQDVGNSGPNARAAGSEDDARSSDPAYVGLGFEPVVHHRADAWARWEQRLAEAAQALELAERAGQRLRDPEAPLETPRGRLRGPGHPGQEIDWARVLSRHCVGQPFDAFATTVASLDLDLGADPWSDARNEGTRGS